MTDGRPLLSESPVTPSSTNDTFPPAQASAGSAWNTPFPAEFDAALYVGHPANTDLAGFGPDEARTHYQRYGQNAGRICGAVEARKHFLALIPKDVALLEIGPFCNPCFRRPHHDVRYLDAFTSEELRAQVRKLGWPLEDKVPEIDYVWSGGSYQSLIDERFDVVFSSHNIEHQPCLVTHLNDVASLLRPGGRFFLNVPDKRYCFDHFRPESTIVEALDAYAERRTRHTARMVLAGRMLLTHNQPDAHWRGEHGNDPRKRVVDAAYARNVRTQLDVLTRQTGYVDAHAWQFTPDSFRLLIDLLHAANLITLGIERVYPTVRPYNEFHAILRHTTP